MILQSISLSAISNYLIALILIIAFLVYHFRVRKYYKGQIVERNKIIDKTIMKTPQGKAGEAKMWGEYYKPFPKGKWVLLGLGLLFFCSTWMAFFV